MSRVLDASALLALFLEEPGSARVISVIEAGAAIIAVNLAEVVTRSIDLGLDIEPLRERLSNFQIAVYAFDSAQAWQAALLRPATRTAGLSLGDRACLALARELKLPALTADRSWARLSLDIDIEVIR
ncbi:MAG: PIN domain-containing protein [Dehalococcoidia bacterium]|nr:PIN domain-containing protein [Dehalococcoidia bacterium]